MSNSDPSQSIRDLVLSRDQCRCVRCGIPIGYHTPFSIHHRRLRAHKWPGLNLPSNLITLCGTGTTGCHGWVHAHPEQSRSLGYMVSAYNDHPEQCQVWNHDGQWMWLDNDGGHAQPE